MTVFHVEENNRSRTIAEAMASGLKRCGVDYERAIGRTYRAPTSDVAVFYGLNGHQHVLRDYRRRGRAAIYIDLGYWGRHEGGRRAGFHKIALNARHPTAYFQRRHHDPARFDHFGIPVRSWRGPRSDGFILLAGMSAKAAKAEGFAPEEWEQKAVKEIRKHTDRRIVYRPKPNWPGARRIPGTDLVRGKDGDVEAWLSRCHAVVTHHSNVAVEAILHGVPAFAWDGVATAPGKASSDLSRIEDPPEATDVYRWASDIAWTQWNVEEMRSGDAWNYLREEGLVPS